MSLLKTAAVLGSIAATTYAHGHVSGVVVDGEYYQGYDPSFQYMPEAPKVVGWSTPDDLGNGFIAPSAYSTPDIICHLGASPAQKAAKVAAGGTVEIQWTDWPESHHGPVIDYLAKCANDDCSTVTKADLEFFKIGATGLINDDPTPGTWGADKLRLNNNTWVATIPEDIAPGQYVLRNEIIALHSAGQADGAQNYPMCISIEVTGSGTATPSGVKGTALYQEDDAGIVVNIYQALDSYSIPGPALYAGAASGSDAGTTGSMTTQAVASSTKATSSAAPTTQAATTSAAIAPAATISAASTAGNAAAVDTCTSTITISTSTTAEGTATATPSVYTAPLNTANAAVSALASAIPSSALTATISQGLPSPAAFGSSKSSGSAAAGMPSKPLPEGFTLKDLLEWVSYLLGKAVTENSVHARDFAMRR